MEKLDKVMALKKEVVDGTFYVDGMEVAIINNNYIGDDDALALGKIAFQGYGYVLLPLTDEEYKVASDKYNELMDLFI